MTKAINWICLLLLANPILTKAQTTLAVNTDSVIARGLGSKLGLNLNAGIDADANRPAGAQPLTTAVQEMGAKRLRFPGGEKSNYYVWAAAPYTSAATAHWVPGSYYAGASRNTLNTDQFVAICQQAGAQAHISVAYNPAAGLDEQVAAAWVRYANQTKGYGIRYWEVGNEMWNKKGLSAGQAGAVAARYVAAMKAVDPTIKVGISWNSRAGFQSILAAAPGLDFVACSNYTTPGFASYSSYANTANVDLLPGAREALSAVGNGPKTVVVSEFNALNLIGEGGWANTNDLGHALVNFETMGQLLTTPQIEYGALWNSRWFGEETSAFTLYTALNSANGLHASGLAMAVWGRFLREQLVRSTSSATIKTYAAHDAQTGALNIFLVNKAEQAQRVVVPVTSGHTYAASAGVWRLTGTSAADRFPTWSRSDSVRVAGNTVAGLNLPAVSVTVLSLTPSRAGRAAANGVINGGFENGALAPWATWLGGGQAGLSTATKRAGNSAAWAGGGPVYLYQVVEGLTPGTTYTLTGAVKAHSTSGASAWVGVKNTGGSTPGQDVADTHGDWSPVALTFTTGSAQTTAEIYLWNSDATTWAWIDEIRLSPGALGASQLLSASAHLQADASSLSAAKPVVFPNPFRSAFSLVLPEQQGQPTIQLLDARGVVISGVQVQLAGRQSHVVPPATLPPGLYLLRLTGPGGKTTLHKVVKE